MHGLPVFDVLFIHSCMIISITVDCIVMQQLTYDLNKSIPSPSLEMFNIMYHVGGSCRKEVFPRKMDMWLFIN